MDRGILILVAIALFIMFFIGRVTAREEIKERALEYNTNCYTNENLSYIIFGESQL